MDASTTCLGTTTGTAGAGTGIANKVVIRGITPVEPGTTPPAIISWYSDFILASLWQNSEQDGSARTADNWCGLQWADVTAATTTPV